MPPSLFVTHQLLVGSEIKIVFNIGYSLGLLVTHLNGGSRFYPDLHVISYPSASLKQITTYASPVVCVFPGHIRTLWVCARLSHGAALVWIWQSGRGIVFFVFINFALRLHNSCDCNTVFFGATHRIHSPKELTFILTSQKRLVLCHSPFSKKKTF